jgi:hypothetical protein
MLQWGGGDTEKEFWNVHRQQNQIPFGGTTGTPQEDGSNGESF